MTLTAPSVENESHEPIPEDVYIAALYSLIDIGTQTSNNPQYPDRRQVVLTWEIPSIMQIWKEDGPEEPAAISAFYNFVMFQSTNGSQSNLLKMVNSWRGKELTKEERPKFQFDRLLGQWCQLQVMHHTKKSGDVIAKVQQVMKLVKGMPHPEQLHNPKLIWSINNLDPNKDLESQLPPVPEWQAKLICKSQEFQAILQQQEQAGGRENHSADTDEEFFV